MSVSNFFIIITFAEDEASTLNCSFIMVTLYNIFFFTGKPLWELILEQFDDLLVKILLLAAVISFVSIIFN